MALSVEIEVKLENWDRLNFALIFDDKIIFIGSAPGFLHSWWLVIWLHTKYDGKHGTVVSLNPTVNNVSNKLFIIVFTFQKMTD